MQGTTGVNLRSLYPNLHAEHDRHHATSIALPATRAGNGTGHNNNNSSSSNTSRQRRAAPESRMGPRSSRLRPTSEGNNTRKPASSRVTRSVPGPAIRVPIATSHDPDASGDDTPTRPLARRRRPPDGLAVAPTCDHLRDLKDDDSNDDDHGPQVSPEPQDTSPRPRPTTTSSDRLVASRVVALRGEVGPTPTWPRDAPPATTCSTAGALAARPASRQRRRLEELRGSSSRSLPAPNDLNVNTDSRGATPPLQELVCNPRPRSRYARRETIHTLQRIHSSASLPALLRESELAVRPSTSSSSMETARGGGENHLRRMMTTTTSSGHRAAAPGEGLRACLSTSALLRDPRSRAAPPPHAASRQAPAITAASSWTAEDISSFFLTELDAASAVEHEPPEQRRRQWAIARALARGAHCLYALDEPERAIAAWSAAIPEVHALASDGVGDGDDDDVTGPPALLALLHHHMGLAFKEQGQDRWALMMQKKALELAQAGDDPRLQGRALKALGVLFLDRGDLDKALDCQQEALRLATAHDDRELEARVYANLGNLASAQGQLRHARACHERDLAASSVPGEESAVGQARAHRNLSIVLAKLRGGSVGDDGSPLGDDDMDDKDREDKLEAQELEHELQAARLVAANAFETDMRRQPHHAIGNIYLQLTRPDSVIAQRVTAALHEVLSGHLEGPDEDEAQQQQQDANDAKDQEHEGEHSVLHDHHDT